MIELGEAKVSPFLFAYIKTLFYICPNQKHKAMYKVYNNVEDKIIFSGNESEFIDFMKKIAIENEDFDFSILGISDAKEYLEDYCDNLVNVW